MKPAIGVEFDLSLLKELVELESPSRDKALCDCVATRLARLCASICESELVANPHGGDHVILRSQFKSDEKGDPIPEDRKPGLILAHYDTVWPRGTIDRFPFAVDEGIARGPGVFDMKASLVILERAIHRLSGVHRNFRVLITSDEEIGSPNSRALIEQMARDSEYVLVMEPPLPDGSLKTARKGVGLFTVEARGKSAHAGVEPEKGANAIVELAHQVLRMSSFARPTLGTTLSVGTIKGGTTSNVVPDRASFQVDVRVSRLDEAERIDGLMRSLTAITPETTLHVTGGFNRPPMERTPEVATLYERARAIGISIGLELGEGSTGGGSDANFTAALGIPTLDGFGAMGGGAHAESEHIQIDSIPERAALLAALLANL